MKIKKIHTITFILLAFLSLQFMTSFAQTPNSVRVEGVIKPIKSDRQQRISFVKSNFKRFSFSTDSDLKFSGDIPLDKPEYFEMSGMYKLKTTCYLKPGIKVKVVIVEIAHNMWDYHFIGEGITNINTYLIKKAQITEGIQKSYGVEDIYKLSGVEYLNAMNTIEKQVGALLEEMNLEPGFTKIEKDKLAQNKLNQLVQFPIVSGFMGYNTQLPDNFYDEFLSYNLNIPFSAHKKFSISKAFELQYLQMAKAKKISVFQAQKNIIKGIDYHDTKDFLIKMMSRFALSKMPSSEKYLKYVLKNVDDVDFTKDLQSKYDSISSINMGNAYPPLNNMKDLNDEYVNLSDFKGKYVFLDLWATWCGPCKAQVPYLKELEKAYHGKNIEFVSLSIDKPNAVDKWKGMVKKMELGGVQLVMDHYNKNHIDFLEHFKITGIPHFIIFDPKGNVVHPDTPKPSDEALLKELFDTLKLN